MISRIEKDHRRFREIVRGKVRQNLRKYMSRGDIIAPQGKGTVTIPMPQIKIPRFSFGSNKGNGVGQGDGEPGDPVGGDPQDGQGGKGKAGQDEGQKALELGLCIGMQCFAGGYCTADDPTNMQCITCIALSLISPQPPGCEEQAMACK